MRPSQLPSIPKPESLVAIESLVQLGDEIAHALATVDSVETLEDWRAKTAALALYLKGKELHRPMMGAQRKIEARIGQLLGHAEETNGRREPFPTTGKVIKHADRNRFRILARGLEGGLTDAEWMQPRDDVIALIQRKYPVPKRQPAYVDSSGIERKPRAQRVKEIRKRAAEGMRASQIADDIGVSEQIVRRIARAANITLPDKAIGNARRLDAVRILTETVNGIDAYVSGLSLLDGAELPELPDNEARDLMQSLARSLNGLRKLRTAMEERYARHRNSAA